jgi:flagellar motor switch protein FliM
MEEHPAWPMISRLPVMLAVTIPLSGFRVCDLLALVGGQTIESSWAATEDVPLKVGALQVCWGEFEVLERRMALRLTRLA